MKTIYIDMDMTLNKIWIPFYEKFNKKYNIKNRINKEDLIHYEFGLNVEHESEQNAFYKMSQIFNSKNFWFDAPVQEDAQKVVYKLIKKYKNIFIVTKLWTQNDYCALEKTRWIRKYFPFFNLDNIIYTGRKDLLIGDFLIDDAPIYMNLTNVEIIAFDYPYNRKYKDVLRVKSWSEIGKFFEVD